MISKSKIFAITTLIVAAAFPEISECQTMQPNTVSTNNTIKGGVSAYADSPSTLPLMHGSACKSLPTQWQGVWKGSVDMKEPDLVKETPLADQQKQYLTGKAVKMSLDLSGGDNGSEIRELTVTDNRRSNDPSPDIIFFHNGGSGHLWVLPGAHIDEHGENGAGDVHIGGNVFIGDNVHIGSSWNGNQGSPQNQYNNGGITFGGPTKFTGRYFKADERLRINGGTQISAGRVDIDAAKMYPNGQTIDITGDSNKGYSIERRADPSSGQNNGSPHTGNLPQSFLKDAHPAETTTVMIAPGVYDQRTVSPVQASDGKIVGYREMLARYSALGPNKMLVEISVGDPGKNNNGFSMRGYLNKEQKP